jgi:hypothetical protein
MIFRPITMLGLGVAMLLSAPALAARDDDPGNPVDDVTQSVPRDTQSERTPGAAEGSSPLGANPARQDLSFGVLDANTDGKLSRDEVRANGSLTTRFDQLDTDRNNALSDAEFAKFEADGDDDRSGKSKAKSKGQRAEDKAQRESQNAEEELDETRD